MAENDARTSLPRRQEDFKDDPRIYFSREDDSYHLEDDDGQDYQWIAKASAWVTSQDEAEQAIYAAQFKTADTKDEIDAPDSKKKRKANEEAKNEAVKKRKAEQDIRNNHNKAIYVTGLPVDTDEQEIQQAFSRYGLIDESWDTNKPRIKLYYDDRKEFKGEALIVYFKPESVPYAIDQLDGTDFRQGKFVDGALRVVAADRSRKVHDVDAEAKEDKGPRKRMSEKDRQKMIAKQEEMNRRLDWDSDEDELVPVGPQINKSARMMVLKGSFTLEELSQDPATYMEIREDLQEQCEAFGPVTSVVLYDLEADGIATVRFATAEAAAACTKRMDGRMFDGRTLKAWLSDGHEKFKKSSKHDTNSEDEERRLAEYSKSISQGDATKAAIKMAGKPTT